MKCPPEFILNQLHYKIKNRPIGSLENDEYLCLERFSESCTAYKVWTLKTTKDNYIFFDTKQEALNMAMLRGLKVHCNEDIIRERYEGIHEFVEKGVLDKSTILNYINNNTKRKIP